jgi:choice-of-anchor C domain-containing protein
MRCLSLLAVLASVCLAAPAPTRKTNLLQNGSFEAGRKIADYFCMRPGDTYVTGWVVTRGEVDIVGAYWKAADGTRSIDLHGSPGIGGIQQTFPTKPGKSYTVTFWLAGNPDGSFPKKRMAVAVAGKVVEFDLDATGKTRADPGWARKGLRFTATEKQSTLEFYSLMTDDTSCGPIIDDVCVTEED